MPIYEYYCESCKKKFDHLARSMKDSDAKLACPHCHSKKTTRDFSLIAAHVSKDSPSPGECGQGGGGCCGGMCQGH